MNKTEATDQESTSVILQPMFNKIYTLLVYYSPSHPFIDSEVEK